MSSVNDFVIKNGVLEKYIGEGGDVIIPDGVTSIGNSAFEDCKQLSSILLHDGLQSIGARAFRKCENLKSIALPYCLKSVGEAAFFECHSLEELIFPPNTVFHGNVIKACWNMKTIILPETIEYFHPSECNKIECIVAPSVLLDNIWENRSASGRSNNKHFAAAVRYIRYNDRYSIKDVVDSYNSYLFKRKIDLLPLVWNYDVVQILSILAENGKISKTNIDDIYLEPAMKAKALNCVSFLLDWKHRNMKERSLDDELTLVEKDPFSVTEMKKLWGYASLDDGTLVISNYKGDETNITIPSRIGEAKVSRIGVYAFSPYMPSSMGVYKRRSPKRVAAINKIKSIVIPEGVAIIDERAFYCSSLENITIPSTVISIEDNAFENCIHLTTITITNGVTSIGSWAFSGCSSLTSITLPDSVTSIGSWAFSGCSSLTNATIPDGVTSIAWNTFSNCSSLKSFMIPNRVMSIGEWAFSGCSDLTSITIPDSVMSIGDEAFRGCAAMISITIPDEVTTIGDSAFIGCQGLAEKNGFVILRDVFYDYFGSDTHVSVLWA